MNEHTKKEAFFAFLTEYADFFREMAEFEEQKLEILLGNRLPEIEHAIAATQANAMELGNLENKRMRLQQAAGLGELSFSQLAHEAPEREREQLGELFGKLSGYLGDIKYYNEKSMSLVQSKLRLRERLTAGREDVHPRVTASAPSTLSAQA